MRFLEQPVACRSWPAIGVQMLLARMVVACAGLSGPATSNAPVDSAGAELRTRPVCSYNGIIFDGDIASGRLNGCRQDGPKKFTLFIHPEDAPINPSAWYAFEVQAETAQTLDITLVYDHGPHRYDPLLSTPGQLPERRPVKVKSDDGRRANVTFDVPAGRTLISAQPLFTLASAEAFLSALSDGTGAKPEVIGQSEQGRDIKAIRFGQLAGETLVLLSGQHPAETKGGIALRAFVERLAEDDVLASEFRSRFGIAAVPAINPDGIEAGHWRHNARGVDLNRDWGRFTQSETRAVRDWLSQQVPLAALMDFHGTWRDVLYTQPDENAGGRADFAKALELGLGQRLGKDAPGRSSSHNRSSPTAKTWFHETFAIPALTYEVGDTTPVDQVIHNARVTAEIAMHYFLGHAREEQP